MFVNTLILPEGMARIATYLRTQGFYVSQESLDAKYIYTHLSTKIKTFDKAEFSVLVKPVYNLLKIKKYVRGEPSGVSERVLNKALTLIEDLTDYLKEEQPLAKEFLMESNFKNFDIVGFSITNVHQLIPALLMAKFVKNQKNVKIVIGGAAFYSVDPSMVLRENCFIDYIITGEGEISMLNLVQHLSGDESIKLTTITGLIYREKNKILQNKKGALPINHLPLPDYSDVIKDYLRAKKSTHCSLIFPYQVSRGCIGNCRFCNFKGGYPISLKSPKIIVQDIKILKKEYGVKNFFFSCNAINMFNSHLSELCQSLIDNKVRINWASYAIPKCLGPKLLRTLKESGCSALFYGIESGSQKILQDLNKGFTIKEAQKVIKNTKKAGISVKIDIMFNMPTQKKEDILKTKEFIEKNKRYIDSINLHQFGLSFNSPDYNSKGRLYTKIKSAYNLLKNKNRIHRTLKSLDISC